MLINQLDRSKSMFFFNIIYIKLAAGCHKTRFCAPLSDALQDLWYNKCARFGENPHSMMLQPKPSEFIGQLCRHLDQKPRQPVFSVHSCALRCNRCEELNCPNCTKYYIKMTSKIQRTARLCHTKWLGGDLSNRFPLLLPSVPINNKSVLFTPTPPLQLSSCW